MYHHADSHIACENAVSSPTVARSPICGDITKVHVHVVGLLPGLPPATDIITIAATILLLQVHSSDIIPTSTSSIHQLYQRRIDIWHNSFHKGLIKGHTITIGQSCCSYTAHHAHRMQHSLFIRLQQCRHWGGWFGLQHTSSKVSFNTVSLVVGLCLHKGVIGTVTTSRVPDCIESSCFAIRDMIYWVLDHSALLFTEQHGDSVCVRERGVLAYPLKGYAPGRDHHVNWQSINSEHRVN